MNSPITFPPPAPVLKLARPSAEKWAATLAEERACNPFLLARAVEELVALRARRDEWKPSPNVPESSERLQTPR